MNLSENYHALAALIRAAKDIKSLEKMEIRITRHYNNGTINAGELRRLDIAVMERKARLPFKPLSEN